VGACICIGYESGADWCVDFVMVCNILVMALSLLLSVGVGLLCLIIGILGSWLGISGVCPV
jgi:hypothetical protein